MKVENPATFDVDRISEILLKDIPCESVDLQPTESGFEGIAKAENGEEFKVIVTLDAADRRLEWNADGNHGTVASGSSSQ